jgi:hypothetical protein
VGSPVACHHHFDERFVSRSEFYQDLLLKHDARYAIGLAVRRDGRSTTHLVLHHGGARGPFRVEQLDAARRLALTRMSRRAPWTMEEATLGSVRTRAGRGRSIL